MGMNLIGLRRGPPLTEQGWERRFVAAPDRIEEARQLYTEMGFEVRTEKVGREELGPQCGACCEVVCNAYAAIYTRKRGASSDA